MLDNITNPKAIKRQSINWVEPMLLLISQLLFSYLILDGIAILAGSKSHMSSFFNMSRWQIASAILLAPIIEEVSFRSFLSGKAKHLWGMPLMLIMVMLAFNELGIIFILCSILVVFAIIVLLTDKRNQVLLLRKHYNKIFFITSLLFALCHLRVIDESISPVFAFCLVFLAFLPASLIFGYVRIKYGLRYSIITHSLNNIAVLSLNSLIY